MEKRYLFTPGPTPVPPEVLAASAEPMVHHRGPDFRDIYARTLSRLKDVYRTESDVLLFTASGTAILSALPEEERLALLERTRLTPLTPFTVTDPKALLERVRVAARRGYAVIMNETVMGDISVAAPIIDEHGRAVAAINISVPTTRWTKECAEAELAQHVHVAATSISKSKFNRYAA